MLLVIFFATLACDQILVTLTIPARLNRRRVILLLHRLLLSLTNIATCAVSIHCPACPFSDALVICQKLSWWGYSLLTLICNLLLLKPNLSSNFGFKYLQILYWDLLCLCNKGIESSSNLSLYLQLLEITSVIIHWVFTEEVTDEDLFDVWFFLWETCAGIVLHATTNLRLFSWIVLSERQSLNGVHFRVWMGAKVFWNSTNCC